MQIPRYWAKGRFAGVDGSGSPRNFTAWGWSSVSEQEAEKRGRERAKSGFLRVMSGEAGDGYGYLDTPLREEVVQAVKSGDEEVGLITRNRYGALVLNTARTMFVDIDRPAPANRGFIDGLKMAFSREHREVREMETHNLVVDRVVSWSRSNPQYGFRLYQTKAGYRLLFTNQLFDPESETVHRVFKELGTDRLYERLTTTQKCFRARLTPKPWRIGTERPDDRYPYTTAEAGNRFKRWLSNYEDLREKYQVCTLIEKFGAGPDAHPEIRAVMEAHDRATCVGDERIALA